MQDCLRGDWHQHSEPVKSIGAQARAFAEDVRLAYGFDPEKIPDVQIVGELLQRHGIKTRSRRGTLQGKRVRIYSVHEENLETIRQIINQTEP